MYFNTTFVNGSELAKYDSQATKQDTQFLEFLVFNKTYSFTAEQIQRFVLYHAPLTSARRALSNLHKRNLIAKGEQVDGQFGRPIHTWQYRMEQ